VTEKEPSSGLTLNQKSRQLFPEIMDMCLGSDKYLIIYLRKGCKRNQSFLKVFWDISYREDADS
jgi:hypothetical protein